MLDQILISFIILVSLVLFVRGKLRYDVVGLLALFTAILLGLLPMEDAFLGFIHPVIVLIVAMVILSKGLLNAGVIDIIARRLKFAQKHPILQLAILTAFTAFLSAFINSMGALAFIIPIAIRMSRQSKTPLSMFLMPIAFASHFGGSITLVGSASNIVVSGFRAQESAQFGFFDFATVALPMALAGIIFIALVGWHLIPKRPDVFSKNASLEKYFTELKIVEGSSAIDKTIRELYEFIKEDFAIFALIRGEHKIPDPSLSMVLRGGDLLIIEAEPSIIETIMSVVKLELVWKKPFAESEDEAKDIEVVEVAVPRSSRLVGETAKGLMLHHWYRLNLLALHHSGAVVEKRIGEVRLKEGDILMLQGRSDRIARFIDSFNLLLLKEREFRIEGRKETLFALGIFVVAIAVSMTAIFPVHIIFSFAALAMIVGGLISPKEIYSSVDLSVIVLLGAMLQLGFIFQSTGAAASFANGIFSLSADITPEIALAVILIMSIMLSDILSNATVAVLMAPVAISVAHLFGVSIDPFLIAVAMGSSSSYLTPLGHQSNTFIMGIGGYRFKDYWRLGLPLEIISFAVAFPLILRFWPF